MAHEFAVVCLFECGLAQVLIRMKVKDGDTAPELARLVYIRNTKIAGVPSLLLRQLLPNCCSHFMPVLSVVGLLPAMVLHHPS
jgi:hypothetical protein